MASEEGDEADRLQPKTLSTMRRNSQALVAMMVKRQKGIIERKRRGAISLTPISIEEIQEEEDRAQKLDGSFFEVVSHLNETQKKRVDEARRESNARVLKPNQRTPSADVLLDRDKRIDLYKEFVYVVLHRIGLRHTDNALTDGEMITYGRAVFDIEEQGHRIVHNEVSKLKPPKCLVNVEVVAATGLDPKDANGLSDPYCMLCLINSGDTLRGSDGKKRKLRNLVKGEDVHITKVMKKTLDPVWKMKFKMDVRDVHNQVLRVDIWDSDDNSVMLDSDNSVTAIRDFRGAGRMFKEIYQSAKSSKDGMRDDFMGLVEVPLKMISEGGSDAWYEVESAKHSSRIHGKMHLRLSFEADASDKSAPHVSTTSPEETYQNFLKAFSHHDMKSKNGSDASAGDDFNDSSLWDCKLCEPAELVLSQYRIQHQLNPLTLSVLHWHVFSNLYVTTGIPVEVLTKIIDTFKKQSASYSDTTIPDKVKFVHSLDEFCSYSIQVLEKYRLVFNVHDMSKCMELGRLLMCLLTIHNLPLYKKRFPDKSLKRDVESVVIKSTKDWFHLLQASYEGLERTIIGQLDGLVSLINSVNADLQEGKKNYEGVFNLIKVNYTLLLFGVVESELSATVEQGTKHLKEEMRKGGDDSLVTKMFELYIAVKDLCNLKLSIQPGASTTGISNFRNWFLDGVSKWIKLAEVKAKSRINKAMELDEVRVINDMVKYSTSAVDVTCCLAQICTFWKSLEWDDVSQRFMFLTQISEIVGDCSMHYSAIIVNQLKKKGFYDDEGQFDVTDQLCIMMNNITHVLTFIQGAPKLLLFEQIIKDFAELHDDSQSKIAKTTLNTIITSAVEDLGNKTEKIIDHIGERMKVTIRLHLLKIIKDHGEHFDKMCDPLLSYLDTNLVTLNSALLGEVFQRVLVNFWRDFVEVVDNVIEKNKLKLLKDHYMTLSNVLELVMKFFHGDGSGLSLDNIHSDAYKKVRHILDLNTSTTLELIERFYEERWPVGSGFHMEGWALGYLTFKVFYCSTTHRLNVNILNCRDLVPMDASGTSDPYISVKLKPDHVFQGVKSHKTKHEKNTLFPLFDQTFQFDVKAADCKHRGATLLFTLYDYDMVAINDDISAEIFFDLSKVVGYDQVIEAGLTRVPQIDIPWCISAMKGETLKTLSSRTHHDPKAMDFMDKVKDRYVGMMDNNNEAKDRLHKK